MKIGLAAVVAGLLSVPAMAQYTGVSHPDEVRITTSVEGIQQPVVYEPAPGLKVRPSATETLAPAPVPTEAPALVASSRDIAVPSPSIHADEDLGIITRVGGASNQLPPGTLLHVKLGQSIATNVTAIGTVFSATLTQPVQRDGRILLPVGSILSGFVTDIHGGKRISGSASIHLRPTFMILPDGTKYALHGQVIDTDLYRRTKVDEEGTIVRRDHAAKTASAMALTTGSGAASGAVFGGVPGAIIGAGVGAGISTVVWLRQDRQTELPAETAIVFSLTEPLTVGLQ